MIYSKAKHVTFVLPLQTWNNLKASNLDHFYGEHPEKFGEFEFRVEDQTFVSLVFQNISDVLYKKIQQLSTVLKSLASELRAKIKRILAIREKYKKKAEMIAKIVSKWLKNHTEQLQFV